MAVSFHMCVGNCKEEKTRGTCFLHPGVCTDSVHAVSTYLERTYVGSRKNWKEVSLRSRSFGRSLLKPQLGVWLVLRVAGRWGVAWVGFLVAPSELTVAGMVGVSQRELSAAYSGGNGLSLWDDEAALPELWPAASRPAVPSCVCVASFLEYIKTRVLMKLAFNTLFSVKLLNDW